jgi:hypothetical protein
LRRLLITAAAVGILATFAGPAAASGDVPPNWHVHDGQTGLGPQHKGIGFFPTILGESTSTYLEDPAMCPNATDKAFLPSWGSSESPLLRAGECQTSTEIIHLRTVPVGTSGPDGWSSITVGSEPGWVTYYFVTSR